MNEVSLQQMSDKDCREYSLQSLSTDVDTINSYLATDNVTPVTVSEVQDVVDASNKIEELATNEDAAPLTVDEYQTLGLDTVDTQEEADLLNDVISSSNPADVDSAEDLTGSSRCCSNSSRCSRR